MTKVRYQNKTHFCTMQISGKKLLLNYEGRQHSLKLDRSMHQLLALLSHPCMPISYLMLDSPPNAVEGKYRQFSDRSELMVNELHIQECFPVVPMTDIKTVVSVTQRLLKIVTELSELEESCDLARIEELQKEQDQLALYLREVYRPQGYFTGFCDENTLLHKRVQKGLLRALKQIKEVEPELARQIKASLKLHQSIVFHPQQVEIEVLGF